MRRFKQGWISLRARVSPHGFGLLLAAILAGSTAAWSMQQHIKNRVAQAQADAYTPTSVRMVAAFDLMANDVFDSAVVATRAVPLAWIHQDALTPDDYLDWEGATLKFPIQQGEQVLSTYLGRHTPAALAAQLAPGRRAVTISVDDVGSQAGLLQPGDRLDIFISLDHAGRRDTSLLLESCRVLAVGSRAQRDDVASAHFSTVTLDVSLQEAKRLIAAKQVANISVVLSNHATAGPRAALVPLSKSVAIALGLATAAPPTIRKTVPILYGIASTSPAAARAPVNNFDDDVRQGEYP